jgi:hypothetical protein
VFHASVDEVEHIDIRAGTAVRMKITGWRVQGAEKFVRGCVLLVCCVFVEFGMANSNVRFSGGW